MDNNQFPRDPQFELLSQADDQVRVDFYKKTYMHVALATLLFVVVEAILLQIKPLVEFMLSLTLDWKWLVVLGVFMLATTYTEKLAHRSHNRAAQYAGLFLYVVAQAIIFIPLIYIAIIYGEMYEQNVLNKAAITTLALFTGLSAVVLITKKDFSFLRSILVIGFFIAIGAIIAGMIFGFDLGLAFSAFMVVLAGGTILYQTSQLVHHYSTDQYVGAALGLFASLMLLFWYILSIFMSRD